MTNLIFEGLLWFCALGCTVIGGLYFAFSAFIMRALGRLGPAAGAAAMNAINADILRSLFMPLFLGTTLGAAGLAIAAGMGMGQAPGPVIAAGLIYGIGMFVCTMAFNVPLNTALAGAGPTEVEAVWARYLRRWTLWNHIRTVASVLAGGLYVAAIAAG